MIGLKKKIGTLGRRDGAGDKELSGGTEDSGKDVLEMIIERS